jgi:hypothetical protein
VSLASEEKYETRVPFHAERSTIPSSGTFRYFTSTRHRFCVLSAYSEGKERVKWAMLFEMLQLRKILSREGLLRDL